jgi:DNA-directed RNA polymerase III subunit RPC6
MAQVPQSTIQEYAEKVYEQCLQAPRDYLFSVDELQEMTPGKGGLELASRVINELLRSRQLQPLTQGSQSVFKAVPKDVIEKYALAISSFSWDRALTHTVRDTESKT